MKQQQDDNIHETLKDAAIYLAEYAATLMAVGAQTSRVQLNTLRTARALGFEANLLVFPKTLSITLLDAEHNRTYTYIKATPRTGINFKANMRLSALSWRAFDRRLPLKALWRMFRLIMKEKGENRWLVLLLASLANMCFCRLFDGNLTSMAIVFAATLAGCVIGSLVTFNTNGGDAIASQTVEEGATLASVPNPTRQGYNFLGWFTDSACTTKADLNTPITSDVTFYAGWEKLVTSEDIQTAIDDIDIPEVPEPTDISGVEKAAKDAKNVAIVGTVLGAIGIVAAIALAIVSFLKRRP